MRNREHQVPRRHQQDWQIVQKVDPESFRVYTVIKFLSILGIAAHTAFIPLFVLLGVHWMSAVNFFSVASWIWARRLNEIGRRDAAVALISSEVIVHAILATVALGWSSGFQSYLLPMIPFTVFNHRISPRTLKLQTIALMFIYFGLFIGAQSSPLQIERWTLNFLYVINTAVVFCGLGLISYYFRQASLMAEQRMADLANLDSLTGLPNRRHLSNALEILRDRAERQGGGFCVAIGDIDHFKRFNDEYSHECGDFVLREVAQQLRTCLRNDDTIGRWGGEEFLLILATNDVVQAAVILERIRLQLETSRFCFEDKSLAITMTFGVALFGAGQNLEASIRLADDRLYLGKQAGRNRVVNGNPA
jgi:diguanylate cyclase (GGDEF)-like protein